jgi:type I restriction enzyme, S subunit
MSFPRYPAYKPSGVAWLGEVPEHWEARKISQLFVGIGSGTTPKSDEIEYYEDGDIPWVVTGDLNDKLLENCSNFITKKAMQAHTTLRQYPKGSVAMAMYGATIGKASLLGIEATVNQACCVLPPSVKANENFLLHFLISARNHLISLATGGGQPNINQDIVRSLRIPLPPVEEQSYIATFLDRETTKIDALIAEQQRLIELLQEKRQAVISQAVTKGLNPDAPMKDSGVEWLGEVPEHWALLKLKHIASFSGGGTPSRENLVFWNGDIPWVSPKDMKVERIVDSEETITETGLRNSSSKLQADGQVLMVVRSGILQHTIPVAINEVPVALNQDMKAIDFGGHRVISEFFLRWVQGLNNLLLLAWAKQGATVESIEQTYLAETIIAIPDLLESAVIIKYLEVELAKFDSLASYAYRAIKLLQERRSALISAAVTGQIDVRGLVPEAVAA